MIISNKHRFIYIAVSKTGTISIGKALSKFNEVKLPKHTSLRGINKYSGIDIDKFFKFCFVRNPFDRAVSIYYQWKKPNNLKHPDRYYYWFLSNTYTFNDFVKVIHRDKPQFWSKLTQTHKLSDDSKRINIDFVGRFESLENDFSKICDIIGIKR